MASPGGDQVVPQRPGPDMLSSNISCASPCVNMQRMSYSRLYKIKTGETNMQGLGLFMQGDFGHQAVYQK